MRKNFLIALAALSLGAITVESVHYLSKENKEKELTFFGNVDVRLVDIAFRVPGYVNALQFEEGDQVKKGDLMCSLDSKTFEFENERANANLLNIHTALVHASTIQKRREALVKDGGVSQEEFEDACSEVEQLAAKYEEAHADLELTKQNLDFTKVFSPSDGVILSRIKEPGSVVQAGDPIFSLSLTSPVWVRAYVDEVNLGKITQGMKAKIYTDTPGLGPFDGTIGYISPIAEFTPKAVQSLELRTSLVYRLRIYVNNPNGLLKQGMPVTVKMIDGTSS
jgi:HlyD family secretion protein